MTRWPGDKEFHMKFRLIEAVGPILWVKNDISCRSTLVRSFLSGYDPRRVRSAAGGGERTVKQGVFSNKLRRSGKNTVLSENERCWWIFVLKNVDWERDGPWSSRMDREWSAVWVSLCPGSGTRDRSMALSVFPIWPLTLLLFLLLENALSKIVNHLSPC